MPFAGIDAFLGTRFSLACFLLMARTLLRVPRVLVRCNVSAALHHLCCAAASMLRCHSSVARHHARRDAAIVLRCGSRSRGGSSGVGGIRQGNVPAASRGPSALRQRGFTAAVVVCSWPSGSGVFSRSKDDATPLRQRHAFDTLSGKRFDIFILSIRCSAAVRATGCNPSFMQ
jgi:hypothetical protein